jgi:hypothetical protein
MLYEYEKKSLARPWSCHIYVQEKAKAKHTVLLLFISIASREMAIYERILVVERTDGNVQISSKMGNVYL